MNLLIIDPADFVGGAELFTIDLIHHLPRANYKIFLATNGHPDYLNKIATDKTDKITLEKVEIKRLKKTGLQSFLNLHKAVSQITQLVEKHQIDLIQTNSIRAHIVGALVARKTKKPLVWIVHDFTFPKFFARLLCKFPKTIITCSIAVKHDLKNKLPRKIWPKLHVIENGMDMREITNIPSQPNLREQLKLKADTRLIGHVGRIDSWKGQEHLIKAAQRASAAIPNSHFIFIGDASPYDQATIAYKKSLIDLISDLNLKTHVTLMGYQQQVLGLIKQLDLLVHTSVQPEPFGRVILEAMAVGVPVIASSKGGGPAEIITHQKDGLIVDPENHKELAAAIIRLLENKYLAQNLVRAASKTLLKKYSIEKTVSRLMKIYVCHCEGA